jgi:amidohydrolase
MNQAEDTKQRLSSVLESRREGLAEITQALMSLAELGFREHRTAAFVREQYDRLGYAYRSGLAITGLRVDLNGGGGPGPRVAVLGELDALPISEHPCANLETHAAHACGHNAQTATALAVAMALVESEALAGLSGGVTVFHVPAEELVDLEFRRGLRREGKLQHLTGKRQLIAEGAFDDIDMAMMVHNSGNLPPDTLAVGLTLNGCVSKSIKFKGKAAHAGTRPWTGINALNAATVAFNAIHILRETFRDEDAVRVHWIITKGGEAVNIVPGEVRADMFIRARSLPALMDADTKVDRALKAGSLAIGGEVEIQTDLSYLPLIQYPQLERAFEANARLVVGADRVQRMGHMGGSTDLGDLSHVMPAIHPYTGGGRGQVHTIEWHAGSIEDAVLHPAKALAMTLVDLLSDGSHLAHAVLSESRPPMTKHDYLDLVARHEKTETYPA